MIEMILKNVEEELTQSYIDYSMSVIVSRALPDVRDWLKPVQRRILFAMHDLKLFYNTKYKKCAAVVWEVLWKYHPHWDSSVYEALVRMAQPFSLRYPLIDGQWNFWSIDWDWAAAMRYTEARLSQVASEMLEEINIWTTEFRDNYDNSRKEPVYLPTKFPNLLCNWIMWIAVWMATNMAPNNLVEIINALILIVENKESSIDEIMELVKWPDFPTWWMIFDSNNIKQVYEKWKWSIVVRWKVHIEEQDWNKLIVIDELPYQVNKSTLVSTIWELVNMKKIEWISDITDESNKDRIRISVELKKWTNESDILIKLYKFTSLQTTFNVNNICLSENWLQPRLMWIKDLLREFVDFRTIVITKRSQFLLDKAKDRLHILEWLQKAIDILDEIIEAIKSSNTRQEAKDKIMNNFWFSESQAEYILLLRLQTLVWLEIQKIVSEIDEKRKEIEYLTWILEDKTKLEALMIQEFNYIKDKYWDKRLTDVVNDWNVYDLNSAMKNLLKMEEMKKEDIILWIWSDFEFKVLYQSRINIIPENTASLIRTNNQERLLVLFEDWWFYIKRLKDFWEWNLKLKWINLNEELWIKSQIVSLNIFHQDYDYLVMLTNKNNIKKISKDLLNSFVKFPTFIMGLEDWEKIINSIYVKKWENVWILSKNWNMLLFDEQFIRPSWKTAWWVRWIMLDEWDDVANMFVYSSQMFIFMHSQYWWKMVSLEDLKFKKRWQAGLKVATIDKWEYLKWWVALDEWMLRFLLKNWKIVEIDTNKVKLKNLYTKLDRISNTEIDKIITIV